jgi:flagellar protein FlaF
MYQFSYAEVLEDDPRDARGNERRAFEHAIALLRAAEAGGTQSRDCIEALQFVRRLWTILIDDLGGPGNDLPEALRADLISIGLWVMKELELIRSGRSENLAGIREVCATICEGLK